MTSYMIIKSIEHRSNKVHCVVHERCLSFVWMAGYDKLYIIIYQVVSIINTRNHPVIIAITHFRDQRIRWWRYTRAVIVKSLTIWLKYVFTPSCNTIVSDWYTNSGHLLIQSKARDSAIQICNQSLIVWGFVV